MKNGVNVNVYLSNGDGTFQPAAAFSTVTPGPFAVTVADLNGDGKMDIATANFNGSASVLLGNGDGTFKAAKTYAAGSGLDSIAVADFNGDGEPDLVVSNYLSSNVSVLLGNGDGTFQSPANYMVGANPDGVVSMRDFSMGTAQAGPCGHRKLHRQRQRVLLAGTPAPNFFTGQQSLGSGVSIICNSRTIACLGTTIIQPALSFITTTWASKPSSSDRAPTFTFTTLRPATGGTPARRYFLTCMISR